MKRMMQMRKITLAGLTIISAFSGAAAVIAVENSKFLHKNSDLQPATPLREAFGKKLEIEEIGTGDVRHSEGIIEIRQVPRVTYYEPAQNSVVTQDISEKAVFISNKTGNGDISVLCTSEEMGEFSARATGEIILTPGSLKMVSAGSGHIEEVDFEMPARCRIYPATP
jgi:hypothetical protein